MLASAMGRNPSEATQDASRRVEAMYYLARSFEQIGYPPSKSIDGDLGQHSGWAVAPQFGGGGREPVAPVGRQRDDPDHRAHP